MKTLLEQVQALIPLAEKAAPQPWALYEDDYETIIFVDHEGTGERPFGYEKVAECDNENLCDEGRPGADDAALIVAACNLDFGAIAAALSAALATPEAGGAGEAHKAFACLMEMAEILTPSHPEFAGNMVWAANLLNRVSATPVGGDVVGEVSKWLDPHRGPASEWKDGVQILHPVLVAREEAEEAELAYWCDMNDEWLQMGREARLDDVIGWQPLPALPNV